MFAITNRTYYVFGVFVHVFRGPHTAEQAMKKSIAGGVSKIALTAKISGPSYKIPFTYKMEVWLSNSEPIS